MSHDKAIFFGKEKRKQYRGAKAVAASCRNHGTDDHSYRNRNYSNMKNKIRSEYEEDDYVDPNEIFDDLEEWEKNEVFHDREGDDV